MKLRYLPGTCSFVVHVALEWIGQPYEAVEVSRAELASEEYRKVCPTGKVPLLYDGDFPITQTLAILHFLHEKYPECPAFGEKSLHAQAHFHQWLTFVNTELHKAFSLYFHAERYVVSDDAQEEVKQKAKENAYQLLGVVSEALGDSDYLLGGFTLVDAYLYVILRWCNKVGLNLDAYDNLVPLRQRIESNAVVAKVMKKEGLEKLG